MRMQFCRCGRENENRRRSLRARLVLLAGAFVLLACWPATLEAQLRIATYNMAQRLGDDDSLRDVLEFIIHDDKPGFDVPISVIVFQEVRAQDVDVLQQMLNEVAPQGVLYAKGTWVNLGEDCCAGGSAMYYQAGVLLEDTSAYQHMYTEAGRYTRRWRLRLLGYDSSDAAFYIYSSHLKAGQGASDQQQRLAGVTTIRENADALPAQTPIIYAGDFNFYSNTEAGYLKFIQGGPAQAFDPLGTGPWSGPLQAIKHSQSPRLIFSGGLIGGGMNQRFDFQLLTEHLQDGQGLSIIDATYRSFGNDGQHHNDAINAGNNFYYPWDVPLSNAIADALHDASDHIPVLAEYQFPARMFVNGPPSNFGTVIQDSDIQLTFTVTNLVPNALTPLGADVLVYEAVGSGDFFGFFADDVEAAGDESVGFVSVDTSNVGSVSGTITFTTDNVAAQNPVIVRNSSGTVIRASQPSFDATREITEQTIELQLDPHTGSHTVFVEVHNLGYDPLQALLNIDDVTGVEPPFSFAGPLQQDIGSAPASLEFAIDTDGLPDGLYEATVTIHTSDEDLPGAGTGSLELLLSAAIGEVSHCPADITGDGIVDVFDLIELINNWGPCDDPRDCPADLTGDDVVDVFDLIELINNWGPCP